MSLAATLFSAAFVLFLLAAHPFVTYPLSLRWMRRSPQAQRGKQAPAAGSAPPIDFTICMCAYNEAAIIRKKAENLLQLKAREPGLQILVYVDGASDETAQLLQSYAPAIECHVATERRGKTHGMNFLVARATGSVLVFTDANVMLDADCLEHLRQDFAAPDVGCVCGNLNYINPGESITAATGSLYWRLEEGIKSLEQQTGSVMGADGSLFAIRRSLHRPPPDHIIDDMYVSFMVLIEGRRIVQSQRARAYELSATSASDEFGRKARIACQAFNVHRLLWPKLRQLDAITRYQYVSHKLLRWLAIYFLGAAALTFLAALCAAGLPQLAFALLLGVGLAAVCGNLYGIKPVLQIQDVLTALLGAGVGVWHSLTGRRYQTWTPAASIRQGE